MMISCIKLLAALCAPKYKAIIRLAGSDGQAAAKKNARPHSSTMIFRDKQTNK